jgi:predicted Zn-dependent protease
MLTRSVYLNAAAWFGEAIHEEALQEVIAVSDPDPRFLAYRRQMISYLLGNMEECTEQLDLLEPYLHMDPWMQVIRSRAQTELGDTTGAFRSVSRALEMAPLEPSLHFEYLQMLASMASYEQALMQADTMLFIFGYSRSDLADYLDSIPGIDTSRALFEWR